MGELAAKPVFARYASYYDALYADKDYSGEVDFVLKQLGTTTGCLLDIGSGTGRHALAFAARGLSVTGLDASAEMVAIAQDRLRAHANSCDFIVGDIRSFDLGCQFSAAVSLFHVVSYLVDPQDLCLAFSAVRRHLDRGKPFLFDFWHLPGVRQEPPELRERQLTVGNHTILRRMIPAWRDPLVDLAIEISYPHAVGTESFAETHRLRAWLPDEIASALGASGFSVETWGGGLANLPLRESDWHGWALARAI